MQGGLTRFSDMTRVDFYILGPGNNSRDKLACALAGKAMGQGLNVHIHTDDRETAVVMDDLLWTFRDISFIPHGLADERDLNYTPVCIGWNGMNPDNREILINLGTEIPEFAGSFARVMEIVVSDDDSRSQSRDHYRRYRDMGFEMHSHELESDNATI